MKYWLIFALAITSAVFGSEVKVKQHNISVPAVEIKNDRISNGQTADDGQFPYQVYLTFIHNDYTPNYCGGSLIGRNWVLTAAHCMENVLTATVHLGATSRSSPEVSHTVSANNIIIHSGYDGDILKNDISLIKIPTVTYSARIQPIKLPAISHSYNSYEGYTAIASGWGRIFRYTEYLQWARMPIISNAKCSRHIDSQFLSSALCVATRGGVSTCLGDSGGPLVLEGANIQVGVSSFAEEYCMSQNVAGFTRVTMYLDWIKYYTGISY